MNMKEINEKLKKYNQTHLLKFYDTLSRNEKENLINQINTIDFDLIDTLYKKTKFKTSENFFIESIDSIDKISLKDKEKYISLGNNIIKNNRYAVVTMAGGQGTRLGFDGPKGTYILKNGKSIFEILCDNLKESYNTYGVKIHWYIMTSRENNECTVDFFEKNNYFDYGKENISFFSQNHLPMLDEEGKIILESTSSLKLASDGSGGVFNALNEIINELNINNIEWVYISGIDNILSVLVDPLFIGLTIYNKNKVSSKSILKTDPNEKTGVFCKRNKHPGVLEYTEITDELRYARKDNNELLYCENNILSNLFNIEILNNVISKPLEYHVAHKKCNILDNHGNICEVNNPNAYKFESFIFDIFGYVDDLLLLRVKREDEFAPIKNKEGIDSPQTALELYNNKNKKTD